MLEVLQALHRQVVKGRIAPAAIESDLAAWYKAHGPAAEVEDAG
jgi:hypothetical protein